MRVEGGTAAVRIAPWVVDAAEERTKSAYMGWLVNEYAAYMM